MQIKVWTKAEQNYFFFLEKSQSQKLKSKILLTKKKLKIVFAYISEHCASFETVCMSFFRKYLNILDNEFIEYKELTWHFQVQNLICSIPIFFR